MARSIRGFVLVVVLFVSSLLYSTVLLFPCLPLLMLPPPFYITARRLYRRWTGFVGYLFFAMAVYLLEDFCEIKVSKTRTMIMCEAQGGIASALEWCLTARTR